jgi:hypothetical protein
MHSGSAIGGKSYVKRKYASASARVTSSPAYWAAASSSSSSPTRGPVAIPSSRASSSPRSSGAGRPRRCCAATSWRAPGQRVGEHLAGERQVGRDGLLGTIAAGGQTIGDRQQGHVDLDRRARPQVGEHAPPGQRLGLVDEEPEAQVVAHERGHVRPQPLARVQPFEHRAGELRAAHVVADERHTSVHRAYRARQRLGRVVQQRPPTQCLAAGELVRERLREQRTDLVAPCADARPQLARCRRCPRARPRLSVGRQLDRPVEHLERVAVDIEVMEAALRHPTQRLQLRQDHRRRADRVHHLEARPHPSGGDDPSQLDEHALGGHAAQALHVDGGAAQRLGVGLELQLERQAHQAKHPQRVLGERAVRGHPQAPGAKIRHAAERVDGWPAGQRLGDGVDREVTQHEVLLDLLPAHRLDVALPGVLACNHPPGAEVL